MVLMFIPFGILADRVGRRPVYVFGILMLGLGWGLYPFAESVNQLLAYRMVYAIGVAACTGTLATLVNDYPVDSSRGKFIGVTAMLNVLGTTFVARGIGGIPDVLTARGVDPVTAGKAMYLSMSAFA